MGIFRQQDVAVVVKIADQGSFAAGIEHALLDFRHRGGGLWDVYRDANHFGARGRQFQALLRRGSDVSGVGIGHRLNDDRRATTDRHLPDFHRMSLASMRHDSSAPGSKLGSCTTKALSVNASMNYIANFTVPGS